MVTEMTTIKGNKLIAEFDGWSFGTLNGWMSGSFETFYQKDGDGEIIRTCREEKLKYHTSWDWLMPVVEKIKLLKIEDFSKKKSVMNALMDVDISILWQAVVEFIQWYNKLIPKRK